MMLYCALPIKFWESNSNTKLDLVVSSSPAIKNEFIPVFGPDRKRGKFCWYEKHPTIMNSIC